MPGQNASALLISTVVHVVLLGMMGFYRYSTSQEIPAVAVETVIADERVQQEFEQDLQVDTRVSESLSVTAGGMVTTAIGAAASQPVAQTKIEQSEALKDPEIKVTTISDITIPGAGQLSVDLGEGEIEGEVGARVEGYGAAMHRITQEIIRMMRRQPVLVVWLFDASVSLRDDREEIQENFYKIYEELNIASEQAKGRGQRFSPLETMVCSFGKGINELLPKPTDDIKAIRKAIDEIEEDKSGVEMPFSSINKLIDKYGAGAARADRKLAFVLLTDETGEDADMLEEVIAKTERFEIPVYFLSREAIFGYPYAREKWVDPKTDLPHWIRVDRGPETAFPECLQYDGFHDRWDSQSSGFGPFAQVRLAKKSGGIFFLLAGEEENLIGWTARMARKFDDLAMKEYEPDLVSKREYVAERNKSEFRRAVWEVIQALNPHTDDTLNIRTHHFPMDAVEFDREGLIAFERCLYSLKRMNDGIRMLEKIKPLRAEEAEPRWRAAFDLAYAQLLAYRVRQFQYLLAMDRHKKERPLPKDPKSNTWDIHYVKRMIEPDPQQVAATKVDMEELEKQRTLALELYDFVIKEHPGTPWAQRAQLEKSWGFGVEFRDRFWDPRYNDPRYREGVPSKI